MLITIVTIRSVKITFIPASPVINVVPMPFSWQLVSGDRVLYLWSTSLLCQSGSWYDPLLLISSTDWSTSKSLKCSLVFYDFWELSLVGITLLDHYLSVSLSLLPVADASNSFVSSFSSFFVTPSEYFTTCTR